MTTNEIRILIDRYYAGDISPEEYHSLTSALKGSGQPTPDLDVERKIFIALDSFEPVIPEDLETRLDRAINSRIRRRKVIIVISTAAAAVISAVMTIGMLHNGMSQVSDTENIARISLSYPSHRHAEPKVTGISSTETETALTEDKAKEDKKTVKRSTIPSKSKKTLPPHDGSYRNLEKDIESVDKALLDVISDICKSRNNVEICMEEMKISQKTDFNLN